ncbi:helix-turn-helix transcriptional regulator [Sulfuritalea sp.]|uniref:helix-turn-helix transcriptional regulator n=1 Tax=Sulfuritalea sp. TaxID=2480090 RepID=UPI001ACE4632|nr:helix-turn-helix transcriptional regulator [Sulfuritalea sp.]MBN8475212.1 helix-turn-helix transcriptional regulator [Sulfuritalea sp.]
MDTTTKDSITANQAFHDEAADAEFIRAVGNRVREARARRGMSRKALALSSAVSERYLAQVESGETNPSIMVLRHVTHALGISLLELIEPQQGSNEYRLIAHFLEQLSPSRLEDAMLRLMRDFGSEDAARRRRIALVGLRGAGKSTLGRSLAAELAIPFVELNGAIEAEAGVSLNEIFMLYGQPGFRRLERRCLENIVARHEAAVITVGGGIVSEAETFNLLLMNCYTVWVKASPEEHMARVVAQGDLRPMEGSAEAMEDMRRILVARESLYSKADFTLDTTGRTPEECLTQLRQTVTAHP